MANFEYPDWALAAAEQQWAPPQLPDVDRDRIESLQNGFLAATQEALHIGPDAFYRKTGQDAVEGVPVLKERLSRLREGALDRAPDEAERAALAPRLDANL